jgi:hypothetical protein
MIYNKLYTYTIEYPVILPADGYSSTDAENINDQSDYYILLEKNYLPEETNIEFYKAGTTDTNLEWISLTFETFDQYYNKLQITNIDPNDSSIRDILVECKSTKPTDMTNVINPVNTLFVHFV